MKRGMEALCRHGEHYFGGQTPPLCRPCINAAKSSRSDQRKQKRIGTLEWELRQVKRRLELASKVIEKETPLSPVVTDLLESLADWSKEDLPLNAEDVLTEFRGPLLAAIQRAITEARKGAA